MSDEDTRRARNVAEYLQSSGYEVRYTVWASTAAEWSGVGELPSVGSGTDMLPALKLMERDEVIVWLSDGFCTSHPVEGQLHIWVGPSSITQQPGEHVDWDLKEAVT